MWWICLAAVALILVIPLVILIKKKKFDKYDVLKYVFGIITPLVVASLVGCGIDVVNHVKRMDLWKYDDTVDVFYGYYRDENGETEKVVELFEWAAYKTDPHAPIKMGTNFSVRKYADFEEYLVTTPYYVGETIDGEGVKTVKFAYQNMEWTLVRVSKNDYKWNYLYDVYEGIETEFRTKESDLLVFKYRTMGNRSGESGILSFWVKSPEKFENFMRSVESFAGTDSVAGGVMRFKFSMPDGNTYCIVKSPKDTVGYIWRPEPLP